MIISGPQTQIVASSAKISFNCHARGYLVFWQIDGRIPTHENSYEYDKKGFHFDYDINENVEHEHNNTITVEANTSNNNTRFSCISIGLNNDQFAYQEASLIIAGVVSRV